MLPGLRRNVRLGLLLRRLAILAIARFGPGIACGAVAVRGVSLILGIGNVGSAHWGPPAVWIGLPASRRQGR